MLEQMRIYDGQVPGISMLISRCKVEMIGYSCFLTLLEQLKVTLFTMAYGFRTFLQGLPG